MNKIKYSEERDPETGFSYFGARYYDPEISTLWLSVDPMSDKYPGILPYAYSAWNPVRLVNPDGKRVIPTSAEALEMIKRTIPEAAIAYVQLNDDGSINYPMLSQYSCNSQNYRDLIALSKFSYDITVSISESFEFCDRNENIVQCYDFMDENTGLYNLNNREQTLNPYEPENHGQYYQMELSPLLNYNNVYHVRVIYHYYRQTIRIYIVK